MMNESSVLTKEQITDFLDGVPLGTASEEREQTKRWVETSAQHARNEAYWRDRALKAEGWTGDAERDALGNVGAEKPWVIIDTRSIVGNTPLFWMPKGAGYGSVISEIGRYSEAEAKGKRDTDFPVELELVIECARPRVDFQLLQTKLQERGRTVPSFGWGHAPRCVDCEKKAKIRRSR